MKKKSLVERLNNLVISFGDNLAWIYFFIVLISVYEVFMRYLFNRPTVWVHETSLALAAILMFYGGLYAYSKDKHISVSVVVDLLPDKVKKYFTLASNLIGFIFILLLSISVLKFSKLALFAPSGKFQLERSGSSWNSVFPGIVKFCMSIFVVAFVLLIAVHIFFEIKELIVGKKKEE